MAIRPTSNSSNRGNVYRKKLLPEFFMGFYKRLAILAGVLLLMAGSYLLLPSNDSTTAPPTPPATVTPSLPTSPETRIALAKPINHLMVLALEGGLIPSGPYPIVPQYLDDGKQALQALQSGQVQGAVVGLGPLALQVQEDFTPRILASLFTINNLYYVVGRTDRDIWNPWNLKGKRIAVSGNSSILFALIDLLAEQGIEPKDVRLTMVEKNENLQDMLRQGEVDAICTREPYISQILKALGKQVTPLFAARNMGNTFNLVASDGALTTHGEGLQRLLTGLLKAETLLRERPDEAHTQLAKWMEKPRSEIVRELTNIRMHIGLDSSLLLKLEAVHRWSQHATGEHSHDLVDFRKMIFPNILATLQPDRVINQP